MLNIGYYVCFGFPNVGHFFNTESYRSIHFYAMSVIITTFCLQFEKVTYGNVILWRCTVYIVP